MKDRGKIFKNELEEEWYEKAYGKKRNMMTYRMSLPIPEGVKFAVKLIYFARIKYEMFPEHMKEFAHMKFEPTFDIELDEDDYTPNYFEKELDLPFGIVSSKLMYREENSEDTKLHEPTSQAVLSAYKTELEPVPISMEEQAQKDKLEEEENKKREQEARAAQERLEAEKNRLRQEQMLQIQKQEANANKLLIYTKAMTLAFHEVSLTYCLFSSPDLNLTINVTAFRNPKISTKACRSCQSTTRSWRLTSSITPACSESRSISTQSTARLSCKASSTF